MEETPPVIERLEQEFAFLARALEAINRKRAYPLERAHYMLLLQLRDGARAVGDLAAGLALDDSTVTRQVAAMQRRGLVRKLPNPADRRSALVERTAEGAAQAEAMRAARLERLDALFADWPEGDRAALATLLGRFNGSLSKTLSALPADADD